jgi:hypothetical protein
MLVPFSWSARPQKGTGGPVALSYMQRVVTAAIGPTWV